MSWWREKPTILITGNPGVGKSRIAAQFVKETDAQLLDVNKVAIQNKFVIDYDQHALKREYFVEDLTSPETFVDEEKVWDFINNDLILRGDMVGNYVLVYDSPSLFKPHWVDQVYVVETEMNVLHDRLVKRGYSGEKLEFHITNEKYNVVLDEVKEIYDRKIIKRIDNSYEFQFKDAVKRIVDFKEWWQKNRNPVF